MNPPPGGYGPPPGPPGGFVPPPGGAPPGGAPPGGGGYGLPPGPPPGGGFSPPGWNAPPGGYGAGLPPGVSPGSAYGGPPGAAQDQLAIVSLVLGLFSLFMVFCCGPLSIVLGISAVTFGLVSISRIGKEPMRYTGKPLAIAGIVLGALGALGYVLMFVVFGAFSFLSRMSLP